MTTSSRQHRYAGQVTASQHTKGPVVLRDPWARASQPRPADFAVTQFIEDLALDMDVHARPLLDPMLHAQAYQLRTSKGALRLTIPHIPLTQLRVTGETNRFVSTPGRSVYVTGLQLYWPEALSVAAHYLTGEHRTYLGPGAWT